MLKVLTRISFDIGINNWRFDWDCICHPLLSPIRIDSWISAHLIKLLQGVRRRSVLKDASYRLKDSGITACLQLTNPQAAPSITDLRTMRQELHITLREAAGHFNTWPGPLSRIERELSRDDTLATQFQDWLHAQETVPHLAITVCRQRASQVICLRC